jgi:WD40 repeat protein
MKALLAVPLVLALVLAAFPAGAVAPALNFETVVKDPKAAIMDIAWKPDGSFALACGEGGKLFKFASGAWTPVPTGVAVDLNGVDWKPDGSEALIVGAEQTVLRYQGDSVSTVKSGGDVTRPYNAVRWNPTGTEALLVGGSSAWGLVTTYDGTTIKDISIWGTRGIKDLRWSPAGTYCLMVGDDSGVHKYSGGNYTTLTGAQGSFTGIGWNGIDNSALIVALSGRAYRYDGTNFSAVSTNTTENLFSCAWNQNGTVALVTGQDGGIYSYDGTTFKKAHQVGGAPNVWAAGWHPPGDYAIIVGSGPVLKGFSGTPVAPKKDDGKKSGYGDIVPIAGIAFLLVVVMKGRTCRNGRPDRR